MGISKSKATFLISVIGNSNTVLFGLFIGELSGEWVKVKT